MSSLEDLHLALAVANDPSASLDELGRALATVLATGQEAEGELIRRLRDGGATWDQLAAWTGLTRQGIASRAARRGVT